jgi:predicted dehydrogenase
MVNVAVIGLGWWGKTLAGLLKQSERFRIVNAIDPDPRAR